MNKNYYCNNEWFESYEAARAYSDIMLKMTGAYHVVSTREDLDCEVKGMIDSIINAIDHVIDCPAVDGFGCHCDDIINHVEECGK